MTEYLIQDESLIAIADSIRDKTGGTAQMTCDEMVDAIGGIPEDKSVGLIEGTLSNYSNDKVGTIRAGAFAYAVNITNVNLPSAKTIGSNAFHCCSNLTTLSAPAVSSIGNHAFSGCSRLTTLNFPNATTVGSYAFYSCTNLSSVNVTNITNINNGTFASCPAITTLSFPKAISIGGQVYMGAFAYCTKLSSLYLMGSSVCSLTGSSAFTNTPIGNGTGYVYVPSSLLSAYKAASYWSLISAQIKAK